jgi:hypothetical protein
VVDNESGHEQVHMAAFLIHVIYYLCTGGLQILIIYLRRLEAHVTILYVVLLAVGVLYAIVVLIGSDIIDVPGVDFHLGDIHVGEAIKIPSLSPIAIASFVTAFGAFGLIGLWMGNGSEVVSLIWATIGGLLVAAGAHLSFTYFLIRPQGSSEVTRKDVLGAEAEVTTPIPADSVGEIALVAQGGRISYPAKSVTGEPIKRNTTVVVERLVGGIAFVRPQ